MTGAQSINRWHDATTRRDKVVNALTNTNFLGAVVLFLLVLLFLAEPISKIRDHYYSSADFLQQYTLLKVDPPAPIKNGLSGDPAVIHQPWTIFDRDSFLAGEAPLWNPYNGNGVPHLANYQSAALSPFTLPYYLSSFRLASVVSPFLKLFGIGLFMFLFLRQISLGCSASLVGAIALMFGGTNVLWIGYHLPGVVFTLPASLFFVERVFGATIFEPAGAEHVAGSRHPFWPLVGLSLSLATGLLASHPETFYFCFLLIAAYVLFRLIRMCFSRGGGRQSYRTAARLAFQFSAAGLIAVALSAPQLLPFFEYLRNSEITTGRDELTAGRIALRASFWPLSFVPNLLGNPSTGFHPINDIPATNFIEANTVYLGGLILLLAVFSLRDIRADPRVAFFAGAAGVWLIYAYNILGLGVCFRLIPALSIVPVTRSQPIWLFAIACCAAISFDKIANPRTIATSWNRRVSVIAIAGLLTLGAVWFGALRLGRVWSDVIKPYQRQFPSYVSHELWWFTLTFAVGVAGLALLAGVSSHRAKRVLTFIVVTVVVLESGFALRHFFPTIEDRVFYPKTPAISTLQRVVGNSSLAIIGEDTIIADANLVYRLHLPTAYEAIWVRAFDRLYNFMFGGTGLVRNSTTFSEYGLRLFGIEYLLCTESQMRYGPEMGRLFGSMAARNTLGELLDGQRVAQTFTSTDDFLTGISFPVRTFGRADSGELEVTLSEVGNQRILATASIGSDSLGNERDVVIRFPPVTGCKGKTFELAMTSRGGLPGSAIGLITDSAVSYRGGTLTRNGVPAPGTLVFGYLTHDPAHFEAVTTIKPFTLYRLVGGSRYHIVAAAAARPAASDAAAWAQVTAPDFDSDSAVVLPERRIADKPAVESGRMKEARFNVVAERAASVTIDASTSEPGYLVLAKTFYPGWKATVNGASVAVERANYAFTAIPIPAGQSNIRFFYSPASFRNGIIIAGLALFVGGACAAHQVRSGAHRAPNFRGAGAAPATSPSTPS